MKKVLTFILGGLFIFGLLFSQPQENNFADPGGGGSGGRPPGQGLESIEITV